MQNARGNGCYDGLHYWLNKLKFVYWQLHTIKSAIIVCMILRSYKNRFYEIKHIIIHQTHYEKSDWSRAFNQFTMACELDMINAISAADIAFIMSSSTSA